jgi:hypothetical protein
MVEQIKGIILCVFIAKSNMSGVRFRQARLAPCESLRDFDSWHGKFPLLVLSFTIHKLFSCRDKKKSYYQ